MEASSGHDDGHNFAKGRLEYTVIKMEKTKFATGVYKSGGSVKRPMKVGYNYRDFAGKGKYPDFGKIYYGEEEDRGKITQSLEDE
ncbi:hypothetical protein PAECIP111891_05513 [Paenibacillus allorhizoplanae]|uniref:Uncharacterized protein n=1 Tax=Paenibacillus allorhizoplanae TaxID=2905648 RepID=A0ABM9CV09_9BACL|nr:hypothetical protein [Paenibacillus allorhizoplanae]CAH1223391.1 hypothetical protein PAECIP111891_05513 [Paenibacillus allorhizoplanae]